MSFVDTPILEEALLERMADALSRNGFCVLNAAFPQEILISLQAQCEKLSLSGLKPAGIGRLENAQNNQSIRRDRIAWLDEHDEQCQPFLSAMEELRVGLNQRLLLGLFLYESHFACYPAGAFYRKHVDAFRGETNRVLSTVLYLNSEWGDQDGGELVIWREGQSDPIATIQPKLGTLVLFLSEEFPHEVLTAKRERWSVAGWFRVNA